MTEERHRRVLVTGAAGHLGRVLLPRLLAAPDVTAVVALDRRRPALSHPRLTPVVTDLMEADLPRLLAGVDAVIHLAFVLFPSSEERSGGARRVNREGTARLAVASAKAGVRRVVVAGSVAVYGAGPDLPAAIREEWPRRPLPGFAYAEDKAAIEDWLDAFAPAHPALGITRLRLAPIVGPSSQPLLNAIARGRALPHAPAARLQCLHEEDAARAFLAALAGPPGIYNIAAEEPLPWREFAAGDGRFRLVLPLGPLDRAQRALARLTGRFGDAGWLTGFAHPPVIATTRAAERLAWRAERSVADCLAALRA
ncbi:MAG: NAD-dependent epimerase/dehydratase family protein [Rhodospirillales bacterium]|nr:NAD-dependent epimerase/dehydratase family protein [Rhodospirillales bacterium]